MRPIIQIVMVEDNLPDVLVFRECLARRGIAFTLDHYTNGEDAAKAIAAMAKPPDLFVVDLNIPRVHGLDLVRLIRSQEATENAPVAILTSSQLATDKAKASEYGADLYVVKPGGFSEFLSQVGSAIEGFLDRGAAAGGAQLRSTCSPLKQKQHAAPQPSREPAHGDGRTRRARFLR